MNYTSNDQKESRPQISAAKSQATAFRRNKASLPLPQEVRVPSKDVTPLKGLNYSASIKSIISQKLKQIKKEKIGATEKRELLKQEESRKRVMLRVKRETHKS